jgi:hypothetical protein
MLVSSSPKTNFHQLGGPGSGNFDHAGREGEVGGSAASKLQGDPLYIPEPPKLKKAPPIADVGEGATWPVKSVLVEQFYYKGLEEDADEKAIAKYMKQLPKGKYEPVLVDPYYSTHDPLDGSHRVIAAHRLGLKTILAHVRPLQTSGPKINFHQLGGVGSGNFGHAGRPGEIGGSSAGGGSAMERLDGLPKAKNSFLKDAIQPPFVVDENTLQGVSVPSPIGAPVEEVQVDS